MTATGVVGMSSLSAILSGCNAGHDPLHDIGIIHNVVRQMIKKQPRETMAMLVEMGYKYLEFRGTYGENPAELKKYMDEIGLKPLAGGSTLGNLIKGDNLQKTIDDYLQMGKSYLVCYTPTRKLMNEPTWDEAKFNVDELNRIGEICKNNGLRLAFHNHEKEFQKIDGREVYDYLLEHTDPELVKLEVDLFWAHNCTDIRKYFTKYPGRFELVHVKDGFKKDGEKSFSYVGQGELDFQDLLSYRDIAGFKHLIVEHDGTEKNEKECAQSSIDYLNSIKF